MLHEIKSWLRRNLLKLCEKSIAYLYGQRLLVPIFLFNFCRTDPLTIFFGLKTCRSTNFMHFENVGRWNLGPWNCESDAWGLNRYKKNCCIPLIAHFPLDWKKNTIVSEQHIFDRPSSMMLLGLLSPHPDTSWNFAFLKFCSIWVEENWTDRAWQSAQLL